jgi:N-acetylglucosaminyl-diphospho-decaprenol L-rhamnosyltransferase
MVNWSNIVFSVVSHGQSSLVNLLFDDFRRLKFNEVEIILTLNTQEDELEYNLSDLNVKIVKNNFPKGFGENHNRALLGSIKKFFFVINPDIRLCSLDVAELLSSFDNSSVGAVAPIILNSTGFLENNARKFPTVIEIFRKILLRLNSIGYAITSGPMVVDWVAGMFVVYRGSAYKLINGFDQRRFFMYYEDVDICRRLKLMGATVILEPRVSVIHDAQRASHRKLKYFFWHLKSALRYFSGL